ncbi:DnaJ-domain-containing protein, partial [Cystobasidium minutum MCA 4210]|uniref:DnaJ-domain-containing protein n=1 Tax=Cystobasidium minutum MCA 4210 TaxID=1397322 RepID=UPI0034CE9AD5|eukprot:jgi/Rhomi1/170233/fgenesh1_kg.3_\
MFAPASGVASTSKATFIGYRKLHASARQLAKGANHYETLSLPRSATRQQIKAQFYRLSKEYHPDAKPGHEAKFQAISEAYATLGNAEARKIYDNSMTSSSSHSHYRPGGASQSGYYESDNAARRARANYAWDHTRRTNPKYQAHHRQSPFAAHQHGHTKQSHHSHDHDSHFDRMQAREAWRASNMSSGARKRAAYESAQMAKEEDLRNTTGIGRAIQLVSMFLAVLWIGGTLRASAWEKVEGDGIEEDHLQKASKVDSNKAAERESQPQAPCA